MGRKPLVPPTLKRGPFTLEDARNAGLSRWHLEGASWRRLGPETYIWADLADTPMLRLEASMRRLPPDAAFSGLTAAWLHGIDVQPCSPIEVTIPAAAGLVARAGMAIRRVQLGKADVVRIRGIQVTSAVRTIAELCGRLSITEAVVVADAALHLRRVSLQQLTSWGQAATKAAQVWRT